MLNEQAGNAEELKSPGLASEESEAETAELLMSAIMNGATLKDIRGIPDTLMEGIYSYAYDFYQKGRSKDAETFFRFLCLYDMYNASYAMGLAATLQQQKKYQTALEVYVFTFALDQTDYRPLLHAGQCSLLLKQNEQAQQLFRSIINSNVAPAPLKAQAQAYLSATSTSASTAAKPKEEGEEDHA